MSAIEENNAATTEAAALPVAANNEAAVAAANADGENDNRAEKILKAKELYSQGSRNYLVKNYAEAADELSQVCELFGELHGELSDELGMPYLLYAKSLIALAVDENKVIDVPDEEEMDEDDDDDVDADNDEADAENVAKPKTNGSNLETIEESNAEENGAEKKADAVDSTSDKNGVETGNAQGKEESIVSSSEADAVVAKKNGIENGAAKVVELEKPSTSSAANGDVETNEDEEEGEDEATTTLQLAWEILELAAKIFLRQGLSGLPNLAEVQTELANIEFENNIPESARGDYEKALKIYQELPTQYRRAMAEIYYKIGLTYLMQQLNKEAAESLKQACQMISEEIDEISAKEELSVKEKHTIQDMEETKQEICLKIIEIEETQAQQVAEIRAALDSYIKPIGSSSSSDAAKADADGAGCSSSSSSAALKAAAACSSSSASISSSTSKPTDISHLVKRKKPDETSSEAEALESPAKRSAV